VTAHRRQPAASAGKAVTSDAAAVFVPLTVVSGFDRLTVDDLTTGLLLRNERLAVVYGDPTHAEQGHLSMRMHDSSGLAHSRRVDLKHHCVSCTLRAATVAALAHLAGSGEYDALVLQLHPGIEPDAALRGLLHELPPAVQLDAHVTVLGPDWLSTLSGGDTLADHDAAIGADDDRFAATVLCSAIETATTIVLPVAARRPRPFRDPGDAPCPQPSQSAQERCVLDLLAPAAVRLRLCSVLDVPADDLIATGRFEGSRLHPLAEYGIRDPDRTLTPSSGLTLIRWHAARPLHPLRLHAALDQLADGVIRSSGRLDVADQPDSVVGWDSAGESLLLGPIAPCRQRPDQRTSSLALLGDDLDAAHIHAVLDDCLVTDDELALLTSSWGDFTDSLPGWPHRPGGEHADATTHADLHEAPRTRHGDNAA
jgi:G3E family GTPase